MKESINTILLFLVRIVILALVIFGPMYVISAVAEASAEPFNAALWGAWEFLMGC